MGKIKNFSSPPERLCFALAKLHLCLNCTSNACKWRTACAACAFFGFIIKQNADEIRNYFDPKAYINWHCTNEHFTVEEFICANCKYPNSWDGVIERIETVGNLIITVTKVTSKADNLSFHAVSFIKVENEKIISIDEYWGDDGDAPAWRQEMNLGTQIN